MEWEAERPRTLQVSSRPKLTDIRSFGVGQEYSELMKLLELETNGHYLDGNRAWLRSHGFPVQVKGTESQFFLLDGLVTL